MTDPRYIGTILYVGLAIFAALLAAGLLMQERRWSVQRTALLWGAEGLILLLDLYLCFGLLPAPLRLPVSLTVGFLSYSAVFIGGVRGRLLEKGLSAHHVFLRVLHLLVRRPLPVLFSFARPPDGGQIPCAHRAPYCHGAADPAGLPEIRQARLREVSGFRSRAGNS
ncbi:MAG: hypothetical protein ACLUEU_10025 [Oscillospiraceae bacterium]